MRSDEVQRRDTLDQGHSALEEKGLLSEGHPSSPRSPPDEETLTQKTTTTTLFMASALKRRNSSQKFENSGFTEVDVSSKSWLAWRMAEFSVPADYSIHTYNNTLHSDEADFVLLPVSLSFYHRTVSFHFTLTYSTAFVHFYYNHPKLSRTSPSLKC